MDTFKRKSPEEILSSISQLRNGRLTIYIGPVSGSGKTYHMLQEGQSLKRQGIDVVICAVSTLQRPETVDQVGELERVPSIHWMQGNREQKDLNLDALMERRPEAVLVDGLAHRNRPGARFPTRLQDIEFLRSHSISVITTVNVYELEGYTAIARQLTGIYVEHTVPSNTLDMADEVRLIDVTPEMVLSRIAEGHLRPNQDPAFFRRGNLGVLRELALRLVAEDVNASLEEHREELGLVGPSGAAERILVSTQYHWNGAIYIRRGQQIAKRLNGDLLAVTFRKPDKPLTKEAAVFRSSLLKLTAKVDAEFEELVCPQRRLIPRLLVDYAMQQKVTRIVMGHSKQTRWQELRQGSIVNQILRIVRNIDVFLIADRSDSEGERILPARIGSSKGGKQSYRRLSDQEVAERIGEIKRGRFKVYIGAAPGVGKTYTMLREGNDLLRKGIDVKIGLLETHGRQDTLAQIGDLPIIARRSCVYQGATLEEMDTDAIIRSAPDVVLVDELAHTNIPTSETRKRYEDVIRILNAGINVITTMNIQHLESLNDAVEQITGIRVRETVPDNLLRMADEVQLIDVSPQALQNRMREGRIYAMAKVDQALNHFFKTGNLIALREMALREIADDVDERLESLDRNSSLRGPWRRKEVIFVCVNCTPYAERLIRRGFRTAYRLKASWHVTYVRSSVVMTIEMLSTLQALHTLTERLGGTFKILEAPASKYIADVLAGRANQVQATQLVIGQSRESMFSRWTQQSVVNRLIGMSRNRDILIVADYDAETAYNRDNLRNSRK